MTSPPACIEAMTVDSMSYCPLAAPQVSTVDPPSTWSTIYTSTTNLSGLINVSCVDAADCLATGTANGTATTGNPLLAYTHDGGATWIERQFPGYGQFFGGTCITSSDCLAVGDVLDSTSSQFVPFVEQTSDGGATWTPVSIPLTTGQAYAVTCPSATDCLMQVSGSNMEILQSTDGGSTWATVFQPSSPTAVLQSVGSAISCPTSSNCMAVATQLGFGAQITLTPETLSTSDGGSTWTETAMGPAQVDSASSLPEAPDSVSCATPTFCVAAGWQFPFVFSTQTATGGQAVTWVTTDGGATWTSQLQGPAPTATSGSVIFSVSCTSVTSCVEVGDNYLVDVVTSGSGTTFYAVPSSPILAVSTDGGVTWVPESSPSPSDPTLSTLLAGVDCLSDTDCVASGGDGNGSMVGSPTLYAAIIRGTAAGLPPIVTAISPSSGPTAGGTSVTITGTNFTGATAVDFGGVAGTNVNITSSTQMTVTSPAESAGTVDVTVTTPDGTSATSAADQFTYVPPPSVTAIFPTSGPTTGATGVVITGTNFTGATAVDFGGVAGTNVNVTSPTQITATSPAGSAGAVDVTVTTPSGTSATSAADQFTYVLAPVTSTCDPTLLTPRYGAAIAPAPADVGHLIAFGGQDGTTYLGDTEVWNGSQWTLLHTAHSPSARAGAMLAYVQSLNGDVLFGGIGEGGYLNDTWEFQNGDWTQVHPDHVPTARAFGSFAPAHSSYGEVTDSADVSSKISHDVGGDGYQALLFGGENADGVLSDTLEWSGSDWVTLHPKDSPSARSHAAMAIDPEGDTTILFGGSGGSAGFLGDTWQFKAGQWTLLSTNSAPSPRASAVLAEGPAVQSAGNGGQDNGQGNNGQGNGNGGHSQATHGLIHVKKGNHSASNAKQGVGHAIHQEVHDKPGSNSQDNGQGNSSSGARVLVLFGGTNGNGASADTWIWSKGQWTQLTTPTSPDVVSSSAGAYDKVANVLVVATGNTSGGTTSGDTFAFDGTTWAQVGAGATAPSTPTAPVAHAGTSSVQLSWQAATVSGGAPVTSFQITASPGGATMTVSGCPAPTAATFTGLTNGTTYTFQVVAVSQGGNSAPSPASNPVEPVGPPDAPTNVVATASDASATVTWSAPNNGGHPITQYEVTPSPACASCTGLTVVGSPPQTNTTVGGLANGTTYTFVVTATSDLGTSPPSAPSAPTVPNPVAGPPSPPRNLQVTTDSNGQVTVSFDPPASTGGSPVTSYTISVTPAPSPLLSHSKIHAPPRPKHTPRGPVHPHSHPRPHAKPTTTTTPPTTTSTIAPTATTTTSTITPTTTTSTTTSTTTTSTTVPTTPSSSPPPCLVVWLDRCVLYQPSGPATPDPSGTNWLTQFVSSINGSVDLASTCVDANNCVAVGETQPSAPNSAQNPYIAVTHSGASGWSEVAGLPTAVGGFFGVACAGTSSCVAVGGNTVTFTSAPAIAYYTVNGGTNWQAGSVPAGVNVITGVTCMAPSQCVATGYGAVGGFPVSYALRSTDSGATWSIAQTFALSAYYPFTLGNVSCPTASTCVAVGISTSSLTAPFNAGASSIVSNDGGATWTAYPMSTLVAVPPGIAPVANRVSCWSATACMAVGATSFLAGSVTTKTTPVPAIWITTNGAQSWTQLSTTGSFVPSGTPAALADVSCPAADTCFVDGLSYTTVALSGGGGANIPSGFVLQSTSDAGNTWTAGSITTTTGAGFALGSMSCISTSTCIGSGVSGPQATFSTNQSATVIGLTSAPVCTAPNCYVISATQTSHVIQNLSPNTYIICVVATTAYGSSTESCSTYTVNAKNNFSPYFVSSGEPLPYIPQKSPILNPAIQPPNQAEQDDNMYTYFSSLPGTGVAELQQTVGNISLPADNTTNQENYAALNWFNEKVNSNGTTSPEMAQGYPLCGGTVSGDTTTQCDLGGYMGLQHLADGTQQAIFSLWADSADVFTAMQTDNPAQEGNSTCGIFTGEGEGWSCKVPFAPMPNTTYTFQVTRTVNNTNTSATWVAQILGGTNGPLVIGSMIVPASATAPNQQVFPEMYSESNFLEEFGLTFDSFPGGTEYCGTSDTASITWGALNGTTDNGTSVQTSGAHSTYGEDPCSYATEANYGSSTDTVTLGGHAANSPTVTSISPTSGVIGTVVTVNGNSFGMPGIVNTIDFGSASDSWNGGFTSNYGSTGSTQLFVQAPASQNQTVVPLSLLTTQPAGAPAYQPLTAGNFTFSAPAPTVTSVSPNVGLGNSATPVTGPVVIGGTNFTGATGVAFGGVNLANNQYIVNSNTQITIPASDVPPLYEASQTTTDVTVTTPSGSSGRSPSDQFTYVDCALPKVTGVSPNNGLPTGGTSVTIQGSYFTCQVGSVLRSAFLVSFGGQTSPPTSISANSITVASPAAANSATTTVVDVTVITPWGSSATSTADQFTYEYPPTNGYWLVGSDGAIYPFGAASPYGSAKGVTSHPVVGIAATPDGKGYWIVASDGGIFTFGDAVFHGSAGGTTLVQPVVGMAATPDGQGYWLVAADGGIFTFGDAGFHGSASGKTSHPAVGMAVTADGNGYWIVASDGGIFSFGDAAFLGNTYCINYPICTQSLTVNNIVGMLTTPDGAGYWLVGSDGGIFSFGDAAFHGNTYCLNYPYCSQSVSVNNIVGMSATPDGGGYWLVGSDGHVYAFGDANNLGNASATSPIVGIAGRP